MTLSEAIKHCEERIDCSECGKEHKQLAEWLGKLKHYEDLEAQGRLIELPCAVGTMVYCIQQTPTKPVITCTNADEFMLVLCTIEGRFGKTVFLTKEEAEAALKEREQNG